MMLQRRCLPSIRCLDLPAELHNRRELHELALLIPGQKEPPFEQLEAMMRPLKADLKRFGPRMPGGWPCTAHGCVIRHTHEAHMLALLAWLCAARSSLGSQYDVTIQLMRSACCLGAQVRTCRLVPALQA